MISQQSSSPILNHQSHLCTSLGYYTLPPLRHFAFLDKKKNAAIVSPGPEFPSDLGTTIVAVLSKTTYSSCLDADYYHLARLFYRCMLPCYVQAEHMVVCSREIKEETI